MSREPELRFPGFTEPWREVRLGDILTELKDKSTGVEEVYSVSVKKGLINQVKHLGRSYAAKDTSNYNIVHPYDIVYTKSPTGDFPYGIIKQSKINKNVIVSPLYGVFKPKNKAIGIILDAIFSYPIHTNNFLKPIIHKGAKNTINITNKTFLSGKLRFSLPINLNEQQKIADFLTAIDEKIEIQTQKIDRLETYKRGVIQKLFGGEIRFPGFTEPWREVRLGDILTELKDKSTGVEEVYSVSVKKGLINQVKHLGRSYAAKDTSNYNIVHPYDIVYTKSPTGDFPYGIIKQSKINKNVIVSPLYGVFKPKNKAIGIILDAIFSYPIHTNNFLKPIIHKGAKNTINITNKTFLSGKLRFSLPINLNEQQKIADFLTAIDEKIELEKERLEHLQTYKKGLLQKMFV